MGENAAEASTQQGKMAPIILPVSAPQVCVCVSPLDAFGQEILLTLETKSPTNPQHRPMITLNDTEAYLPLVSEPGTRITLPSPLFGPFLMPLTPKRNSIIIDTEKPLCQTARCTVAFSPVPPLNLSFVSLLVMMM